MVKKVCWFLMTVVKNNTWLCQPNYDGELTSEEHGETHSLSRPKSSCVAELITRNFSHFPTKSFCCSCRCFRKKPVKLSWSLKLSQ